MKDKDKQMTVGQLKEWYDQCPEYLRPFVFINPFGRDGRVNYYKLKTLVNTPTVMKLVIEEVNDNKGEER